MIAFPEEGIFMLGGGFLISVRHPFKQYRQKGIDSFASSHYGVKGDENGD